MIELRACETDADYEAWLGVRRVVLPNERAPSLDELKRSIGPDDLNLVAYVDIAQADTRRVGFAAP